MGEGEAESEGYVVAAKPSARRASRAVGAWIVAEGRHRTFESKALAREWARTASPQGYTLWIQDAHPDDDGPADGYLLARRSRMRGNEAELPGEQVGVFDV
jgi:predicted RNA-binding protein with TRAM domain